MDKYEYRVKTEQMLEYMEKKQYKKAMEIADTIDWRRVKNSSMLGTVSEIYECNGENQKSRDILFIAYDRSPGSRKIVYRLGILAVKIGDFQEAMDCYEEFVKLAPKDPNQYILKYKILRAQHAPIEQQIDALKSFKKVEYVERWAYELAKLYQDAGMISECLEECDDLILWFSEGKYVLEAMKLKMQHKPLTPLQQEKYRQCLSEEDASEKATPVVEESSLEKNLQKLEEESVQADAPEEDFGATRVFGLEEEQQAVPQQVEDVVVETAEEAEPVQEKRASSIVQKTIVGATLEEALAKGVASVTGQDQLLETVVPEVQEERTSANEKIEGILQNWEEKQRAVEREIAEKKRQAEAEKQEREAARMELEEQKVFNTMPIIPDDIQKLLNDLENGVLESDIDETEVDVEEEVVTSRSARLMEEEAFVEEADEFEEEEFDEDEDEFEEEEFDEDEDEFEEEEFDEDEDGFEEEEFDEDEDEFEEEEFDEDEDEFEEEEFDEDEDEFEEEEFDEEDFDEEDFDDFEEETSDEDQEKSAFDIDFEDDFAELEEDDDLIAESFEIPVLEEEDDFVEELEEEVVEEKKSALDQLEEEIAYESEKSPGGVSFDTGFVVQGRYDLDVQSEIGLKAGLTEEQKKLFSYFVPVRGMSEQIVDVLEKDKNCSKRYGTSRTGNVLIVGRPGTGKTVLAVNLVKAIQKERKLKQGKVAIVTGDALNKKELSHILGKLKGGALIIEKAGKMNSRTVRELNDLMEEQTGELLIVLEEQRKALEKMLSMHPEFKRKFTSKIELPIFINDELVTFGQTYAKENGYKIDEMGILALYSRIDVMQKEDHAVTVAEVKDIMDEAIEKAQKTNVKHLMKRMFGKRTDSADRVILTEQDFK